MGDLDIPFEPTPPGPLVDDSALMSSGVVVMAATLPTEHGPMPAIVFRFAAADGSGFAPPVVLVTDDRLKGVSNLVTTAVSSAQKAAGE